MNPVDTYIRSGTHSRKPNLPYTPGGDSAGVITKIGKNVKNFKVFFVLVYKQFSNTCLVKKIIQGIEKNFNNFIALTFIKLN